ncbi:MAG: helix-turn-helix transcriptional regulator [Lachnospiraceae bacterium]|nr:helix-turn-helix transcriptional regulator [Lachnospiraceae bacterium]
MAGTWLPGDTRDRIQDLIKSRNMTQAVLAESIGLSESALSRYLAGKTEMLGDGYIIRIAKYFDVSTDFLLGETDIPDRKNYDIEELGLSAKSARLLYTGRIDAHILNLLLENVRFPWLTAMLSRYQKETVRSGIATMNIFLDQIGSVISGQEKIEKDPKGAEDAREAADDIRAVRMPAISADTAAIQECFMQIVKDIKDQGKAAVTDHAIVTAEVMEKLRSELTKGKDSADLKNLTAGDITAAVMRTIASAGIEEADLQGLGDEYQKLLDKMRMKIDDE